MLIDRLIVKFAFSMLFLVFTRVFTQVNTNENKKKTKRIRLNNNRVQFPDDWVGTPTWPPFLF